MVHGGITSASREAIRPILTRYNTLYFYNTQYEGGVCDRNTFCTGSDAGAERRAGWSPYVMKKWGKKIYIVAADYNYGQITAQVGDEVLPRERRRGGRQSTSSRSTSPTSARRSRRSRRPSPTWCLRPGRRRAHLLLPAMGGGGDEEAASRWPRPPSAAATRACVLSPEEGDGIICAFSYFQELDTPANKAFLETFKAKLGANAPYLGGELAMRTYDGVNLWAEGVKKAGSHRPDEGDRGAGERHQLRRAGRARPRSTRRPTTPSLDVYHRRGEEQGLPGAGDLPAAAAVRHAIASATCMKNPNANKQFVVDVKI